MPPTHPQPPAPNGSSSRANGASSISLGNTASNPIPIPNATHPRPPHKPLPSRFSPPSSFLHTLKKNASKLPPPGPAHFEARRRIWLTPSPYHHLSHSASSPSRTPPSASIQRLEDVLARDNAVSDEEIWVSGLESVWKSLVSGRKLKKSLELRHAVKILQAGWIRDGTWPKGSAPPPETDDFLGDAPPQTPLHPSSAPASTPISPIPIEIRTD
ncbi:hypothetical protein JAAARDRAFT_144785 [Jaapia argillacea MUCL 33604]|uniref:Gag1-like clamp domain-containing protein n=1 Tax=Jaapia argillacea MUCL 33604 TaxID=933084 RepID=A0A067QNN1_9AGAM|nr:hypothetical protein JAAARDRAFT_144785 [Jaapia argillacea MUCL 33604]